MGAGGTGGGGTSGDSGGCGCVAAGTTEREGAAAWAALGLLGMIFARRRRS
ncbi:MYXO-CTERM sorting domain-containing protein [Polyangium sp. y55x31]|uniref:MYXO-CTERM sorting domain-containing protein n=1 Tax=Polyangium sp. y55x31 TaxID=3042688 RepID=UPI0024828398|nr:MYXO-CTERM sorting domain-containing protein [Polyangium sp. y55x31]MDI1482566.1 MYXO-CTERM sorting domain-containing protein [Polyangium sp. y55x31]